MPYLDQLSDSVVEHDVSGLIISVDIRVDQIMLEERDTASVFLTEEHSPLEITPEAAASTPSGDMGTGRHGDEQVGTGQGEQPSAATATAAASGVDHGPLSTGVHTEALPEMLRLRDYLEK